MKTIFRIFVAPSVVLTTLLLGALPAVRAQLPIAVVVTNGATAPDGNGTIDIHYSYVPGIYPVVINDAGQIAFEAGLDNTLGGTNNSAIYRDDAFPGDLTTIVHQGQTAPDGNGVFSGVALVPNSSAYPPTLNNAGQVAFLGPLAGTIGGTNAEGLFRGSGGVITQIVRASWSVPDNNGAYGDSYWPLSPCLNGSGQVAFFSTLGGCTNCGDAQGIFRGNGGDRMSITQIIRTGYQTPFGSFYSLSSPALNDQGQVAYAAYPYNGALTSGVFRADGATVTRVAYVGEPAPDGNGVFPDGTFGIPALNNAGQVAFGSSVSSTVGGTNAYGIFRGSGGTLTQIVRWDQPVPDGNGRFETGNGNGTALESMNDTGQVVFSTYIAGTLGGSNISGIYRGDGVTLTRIARAGDLAPDSGGATLTDLYPSYETARDNIAINNSGQVAFLASLSDGGEGIYFYDDHLGLIKVIRTGDTLLGKAVTTLRFDVYNQLGTEGRGLNNRGQVAFGFDDAGSPSPSGFAIWSAPQFQITNIRTVTNDVLLTWNTIPNATNVVQATSGTMDGSYNTNGFADISGAIVVPGLGQVSTNYTDTGGATNAPARYYRVRLVL